jgi:hypothetical protein
MKSLLKLFGIIALVAVIGFSFAACDDGTTGGGSGGGGGGGKGGTFTITNIPAEFNGVDAMVYNLENDSINASNIYIYGANTRISNGRVSFPLTVYSHDTREYYDYRGNDTGCRVEVHLGGIASTRGSIVFGRRGTPRVDFSNGSATKSWNEGDYN